MIDFDKNLRLDDFSLTARAQAHLRELHCSLACSGEAGLRLVVRSAGWAGLEGLLTMAPSACTGDRTLAWQGLRLFVPPESQRLLAGVTIDVSESFGQPRLRFLDLELIRYAQLEPTTLAVQERQP